MRPYQESTDEEEPRPRKKTKQEQESSSDDELARPRRKPKNLPNQLQSSKSGPNLTPDEQIAILECDSHAR